MEDCPEILGKGRYGTVFMAMVEENEEGKPPKPGGVIAVKELLLNPDVGGFGTKMRLDQVMRGQNLRGLGGCWGIMLRFDRLMRGQNLGFVGGSGLWSFQMMRLDHVIHRLRTGYTLFNDS
jgi:hypothetical protein